MDDLLFDPTFWGYATVAITATWGFVLFAARLFAVLRSPAEIEVGPVYCYVTALMLGVGVVYWVNVAARVMRFYSDDRYIAFMDGWLWTGRLVIFEFALLAIVVHMTARWIRTKKQAG